MKENIRILLVDDHSIARESLAVLLTQQQDMDIIGEASDGQMAIEMTHKLRPDAVIMDVRMPVLDGIEATRLIMSDYPNTKVIGFTMNAEADLCAAMENAGAAACISKSVPGEVIIAAIRNCFSA